MSRESKSSTLNKMFRVLQTVNALSPHDTALEGDPVTLEWFSQLVGIPPKECRRIIKKINYGCGDALPRASVDYDEENDTVTPRRLLLAFDGLLKLSRSEAFSLLVALRTSGIDTDGHLARKLTGALPDLELERFSTVGTQSSVPPRALDIVADAVANRTVLSICYIDAGGKVTNREVEPHTVWYDTVEQTWSFSGWCRLRNNVRTFRADRLACPPTPTQETFEVLRDALPASSVDLLSGAREALIAVRDPSSLGSSRIWRGLERSGDTDLEKRHLSPEELEGGAFMATIPWVDGSPWLASAIVRTLGGVEAIEPAGLRSQVADHARRLLATLGACKTT